MRRGRRVTQQRIDATADRMRHGPHWAGAPSVADLDTDDRPLPVEASNWRYPDPWGPCPCRSGVQHSECCGRWPGQYAAVLAARQRLVAS